MEDLQCLSMDTLLMSYGIGVGDRQRRLALKERLKKKYQEKLIFVCPEYHSPQVVFSKDCIETQSMAKALQFSDEYIVKKAAFKLRHALLEFMNDAVPLTWPPTVESCQSKERQPPSLLTLFFKKLLTSENYHQAGEHLERLIMSLSEDVINALSRGDFLTLKHTALGLGLHSLTGQKLPIKILSRLGHCIR